MTDHLLEIHCDTGDEALAELVASRLYLSKCTGSATEPGVIVAYFDDPAHRDEAAASLAGIAGIEVQSVDRERRDWLQLYEQSLEAVLIGEQFIVAPDASLIPPDTDRLSLVIPQEQAFGAGTHESTALCIELLEWLDCEDARGLDIGSGSGILALAMLRLGAKKVVAFDNDLDALPALRENRRRNEIDVHRMPLFIGGYESVAQGEFDLITMNILPEVIMAALPHVVWHLDAGGRLVVSGVLIVRANEVVSHAAHYALELKGEREKGEWWAGVFGLPR